jgi:hypothetical protein
MRTSSGFLRDGAILQAAPEQRDAIFRIEFVDVQSQARTVAFHTLGGVRLAKCQRRDQPGNASG